MAIAPWEQHARQDAPVPNPSAIFNDVEEKEFSYAVIEDQITLLQLNITRLRMHIGILERKVLAWKYRRNTLANISKLPPEILGEIFACVSYGYEPTNNRLEWLQLTHVCSHWRSVALSNPSLWTTPHFHHPRLAEMMIFRSQSLHLSIQINLPNPLPSALKAGIKLAFSHIRRARELVVNLPEYATHGQAVKRSLHLVHHLQSPAPALEDFMVYAAGDSSTERSCLPENLFLGDAPRLKRITLLDWNIPWHSPSLDIYRNLRTLWIICKMPHRTHMPQFPVSVVLPALAQLRSLEDLVLKAPFLPFSEVDVIWCSQRHVFELPLLRYLYLAEQPQMCQVFMAHMSVPARARVALCKVQNPWMSSRIDTHAPNVDRDITVELLRSLKWRIRSFKFANGVFDFWNRPFRSAEGQIHRVPGAAQEPSSSRLDLPTPHLRLTGLLHDWDIPALCQSGLLDEVEMVSVDHFLDTLSGPRHIWRLLGMIRGLRELRVTLDDPRFLNELAPKEITDGPQLEEGSSPTIERGGPLTVSPYVSFPSLDILRCNFTGLRYPEEEWKETVLLLGCAVKNRRELGYGPRVVTFEENLRFAREDNAEIEEMVEMGFLRASSLGDLGRGDGILMT